jgi:endo-1,3(4)-beta-glucanase
MILLRSLSFLVITISAVASIDVLLPLSTTTPNSSFYQNIVHPRQPQRLSLSNKRALHTNKFYSNAILGTGENPVITHPFVILMSAKTPFGATVSFTEQMSLGSQIDSTRVKYFINSILENMRVSATEFTGQNFQVTDVDDPGFSLTIKMSQPGSQATVTMPVVRGMAYVTFEFNAATPRLSTVHSILSVNSQTSGRVTGKRFEISLNNGQIWILYALNGDITLEFRDKQLFGTQAITNVLRLTKKQSDTYANSLFDSHASVYPTGCQLRADVNGLKGTYTFVWQRKGDISTTLLHYGLQHHRQSITTASATATPVLAQSPTKGPMVGYLGNIWVLAEDSLSSMSFLAPRAPAPQFENHIVAQLISDINTGVNLGVSDYYFTGKAFHKYALLCLLADYYKETTLRAKCIQTLESAFDVLLTARNPNALRYDTTWFGLVSASGLPFVFYFN